MLDSQAFQGLDEVIDRLGAEKRDLEAELYHRLGRNLALMRGVVEFSPGIGPGLRRRLGDRLAVLGLVQDLLDARNLGSERLFPELCKGLSAWFGVSRPGVYNLRVGAVSDGSPLLFSELRDLGLILGELLQNSWDHAFPQGQGGEIRIGLEMEGQGNLVLSYRDNGEGLPEGIDMATGGGGGLYLVRALAAELGAVLSVENDHGCSWRMLIPRTRKSPHS